MHYTERRCPHCGRTNGLYTRYAYRDVKSYFSFDGEYLEESFDESQYVGGLKMYCLVCGKYVCKAVDFEKRFPKERDRAHLVCKRDKL